ncbi:MAG: hypothetical protein LQ340_003588 [Diploschistes diacapsis]|nr:MAG: hypothetical protein LQ340_003588 [Diploschistes diacapsis]
MLKSYNIPVDSDAQYGLNAPLPHRSYNPLDQFVGMSRAKYFPFATEFGLQQLSAGSASTVTSGNPVIRDAVYFSIDFETTCHLAADPGMICEVGLSFLDSRQVRGLAPGDRAQNWRRKVDSVHIHIESVPHDQSTKHGHYCSLSRHVFAFHVSKKVKDIEELKVELKRLVNDKAFVRDTKKGERRHVVLIGWDLGLELKWLKELKLFHSLLKVNAADPGAEAGLEPRMKPATEAATAPGAKPSFIFPPSELYTGLLIQISKNAYTPAAVLPFGVQELLDVQGLTWCRTKGGKGQRYKLDKAVARLGIFPSRNHLRPGEDEWEPCRLLHNSGNDAAVTMHLFMAIPLLTDDQRAQTLGDGADLPPGPRIYKMDALRRNQKLYGYHLAHLGDDKPRADPRLSSAKPVDIANDSPAAQSIKQKGEH